MGDDPTRSKGGGDAPHEVAWRRSVQSAAARAVDQAGKLQALAKALETDTKSVEEAGDALNDILGVGRIRRAEEAKSGAASESDTDDEGLNYVNHKYIPANPKIKVWKGEPSYSVMVQGSTWTRNGMNFGVDLIVLHPSGLVLIDESKEEAGLRGYIVQHSGNDIVVKFHGGEGHYSLTGLLLDPNAPKGSEHVEMDTKGSSYVKMLEKGFRSVEIVKEIEKDPMGIGLVALQDRLELERYKKGDIKVQEVVDVETGVTSHSSVLNESSKKRSRTETAEVAEEEHSGLAQLAQVKEEKASAVNSLEEVKEDLDMVDETLTQQTLTTDIWQGRFDELAALASAAGVDKTQISAIRNRPLVEGS